MEEKLETHGEITKASDVVGDTYLSADLVNEMELIGEQVISEAKIETVKREGYPDQKKIGIKFKGRTGVILLLNKTNTKSLIMAYGDEFIEWVGKKIEIKIQKVQFGGKQVDSVLVSPVKS